MCGRTCLTLNNEQIRCACSYKPKGSSTYVKPDLIEEHNDGKEYKPSHNIVPTDVTPVLISGSKFRDSNTDRILKPMMWGIIPQWHKGDYKNHHLTTNNCRIENIKSSKLYGPILKKGGRCVIVAEGFYEWQTTNKLAKNKQPYYIYSPQPSDIKIDNPSTWNNTFDEEDGWKGINILNMAGLYNVWKDEDIIIYSYTVITMESNDTLNWLHHRMPAILNTQDQIDAWLNAKDVKPDMALELLKPVKILSYHQVSTEVNNSRNKSQECNKRIPEKKRKQQKPLTSWFTKCEKRKSSDALESTAKKNNFSGSSQN